MKSLENKHDWIDINQHQKIGEILLQAGKLNLIHLGMALDIQRFEDLQLGEILLAMKTITQEELDLALEIQQFIDEK